MKKDIFTTKFNRILDFEPAELITPQMGWLYMRILHLQSKNAWHPISISDSRLAKICGINRKFLGKIRQQLQDLGLIKATTIFGRGGFSAVQYEILDDSDNLSV